MLDPEPLIIVGSSVRAAAQSAVRAGFSPWCIDQFGDRDLCEASNNVLIAADWPNEIESIIQSAPQAEWLYTGALENHPALVEKLSQQRPLLGCGHETLSIVRDPAWLADTLAKASLPFLPVILPDSCVSDLSLEAGEWMAKPIASGAGIGVRNYQSNHAGATDFGGYYLQRKARGRVISGLYLGVGNSAVLLGMCEQLCRGIDAGEFCYVYSGSLGPLSASDVSGFRPLSPANAATTKAQAGSDALRIRGGEGWGEGESEQNCVDSTHQPLPNVSIDVFEQAQKIGTAIEAGIRTEGALLNGLFGIDFVLDEKTGELSTLEVNPRYTASAELYERAFGWPLMRWHVDACRGADCDAQALLDSVAINGEWSKHGKLIVYAERDFAAPDVVPLVERLSQNRSAECCVEVSDIPQLGTLIRKDEPVCTLLTSQENVSACHEVLLAASHELLAAIDAVAN